MFETIRLDERLAARAGLEPVVLDRLDDVVAIAGPNGAGKTRLLGVIHRQLEQMRKLFEGLSKLVRAEIGRLPEKEGDLLNTQLRYVTEGADTGEAMVSGITFVLLAFVQGSEGELPEHIANSDVVKAMRERLQANVEKDLGELARTVRLRGGLEAALRRGGWPKIVSLTSTKRSDCDREYTRAIIDLDRFPDAKLHEAATIDYLARHPEWAPQHAQHIARAEGFCRTVTALLGMKFGVHVDDTNILATLNGRIVEQDELSAGQQLLLRWAQIIHENVANVHEAIVLLDEPELHLHPSILVEVIDALRRLGPAQLWIATHCVPLLASFSPRQIIYMEGGRATLAGNRIDHVLEGLLGGTNGVGRLRTFLGDAALLAFHQFAAESLVEPRSVELRSGDPQAKQFRTCISSLLTSEHEVQVLEYAAGRGRLIEALTAIPPEGRERLRYHVFNSPMYSSEADAEICRQHLVRLHGADDVSALYWTDLREHQRRGSDKMHAVVLCNVLHEIPPWSWPQLMMDLRECLREDGHLLILEDQRMSEGELPHDRGYLVLDDVELRALFQLSSADAPKLRYSLAYGDRLSLAEIPATFLGRCRVDQVGEALELLRKRALDQIERLRRDTKVEAHRRGRWHAFYALLHTNATLALSRRE